MWTLEVTEGACTGQVFLLEPDRQYCVGKASGAAELCLTDDTVSRRHCLLDVQADAVFVSDAHSLHGTYLNGQFLGKRSMGGDGILDGVGDGNVDAGAGGDENLDANGDLSARMEDGDMLQLGPDVELVLWAGAPQSAQNYIDSPLPGYRVTGVLGAGHSGRVLALEQVESGACYALKEIAISPQDSVRQRALLLREASVCLHLDHPHVLKTHLAKLSATKLYLLTDWCAGGSVRDLLARSGGTLALPQASYILLQVLSALSYVHHASVPKLAYDARDDSFTECMAEGVVHRDLAPGNLLLRSTGEWPEVCIGDFGLAKAYESAGSSGLSDARIARGTFYFMPRQQVLQYRYAKPDTDVWAAAACYYYMLTGKPPKPFDNAHLPEETVACASAIPIGSYLPTLPGRLQMVIDKALTDTPAIGYSSARAFGQALLEALPGAIQDACRAVWQVA